MKTLPRSLHIGVLRGGPSPEYDLSLLTGRHVLRELGETHRPIDIFISRDGKWHINGIERTPERILKNVDVVFNALHGTYGEDGGVQELLDHLGVSYTGSGRLSSGIAMNKWMTKERAVKAGIKTPVYKIVRKTDSVFEKVKDIWNSMVHPFALKPAKGGSAFAFTVVENFDDLLGMTEALISDYDTVLVEEFIPGISTSCLVMDGFRDQGLYSFPPSIALTRGETDEVEEVAKKVHDLLGLSHYSQSDFIVAPRRGVYFLEVNTLPKFSERSLATKALEPVGVTTKQFLHHVIGLAVER